MLGAFLLGTIMVKVFFDSELSRRTLTMLALSSALYMIALALAQAIIALRGHAKVAVGWAVGMATFIAVVLACPTTICSLRVESALVAGSLAALIVFAVVLRSMIRSGVRPPDEDSLLEAFDSMPMEP